MQGPAQTTLSPGVTLEDSRSEIAPPVANLASPTTRAAFVAQPVSVAISLALLSVTGIPLKAASQTANPKSLIAANMGTPATGSITYSAPGAWLRKKKFSAMV